MWRYILSLPKLYTIALSEELKFKLLIIFLSSVLIKTYDWIIASVYGSAWLKRMIHKFDIASFFLINAPKRAGIHVKVFDSEINVWLQNTWNNEQLVLLWYICLIFKPEDLSPYSSLYGKRTTSTILLDLSEQPIFFKKVSLFDIL